MIGGPGFAQVDDVALQQFVSPADQITGGGELLQGSEYLGGPELLGQVGVHVRGVQTELVKAFGIGGKDMAQVKTVLDDGNQSLQALVKGA